MQMTSLTRAPNRFAAPIAEMIWDMKYRYRDPDTVSDDGTKSPGKVHDKSVEDTWLRIATALAGAEQDPQAWIAPFYRALEDFRFLPAGRITSGAGTGRNITLFNCFVMGTIPDSMSGIFDMIKEAALTMQQGGGIGYDFSTLRPKGETVKGVGSDASGPLSFMDVWDAMCRTIMSAGSRRGAMMATMRCDHPDIEDFITAKRDSSRLRMFNLSVLVTDAFMSAVKSDGDWDLVWDGKVKKTLKARELWDRIMRSTYEFAEPGVIFIDRINNLNPLRYLETIAATNPCGEQPLPPYGACLLGSINLARLIDDPFSETARLNDALLEELVSTAVRMLDNVIDLSRFALDEQRQEAQSKRRIGLGVTGVADALLMLRLTYGTEEAAVQVEDWLKRIAHAATRASVELAKEKGAFPLFDADPYLASPTIQKLDPELKDEIRKHGVRNALTTSIAPTGTISLYAGNVSSGIEPVFAYSYTRKVLQPDGRRIEEEVCDYAVALYREMFDISDDSELPDYFVSAMALEPMDHVRMQAAAQKWVDSSISKTINCPADISFEAFKEIYLEAFDSGCKGCTTYRPNDVTGSVLSTAPEKTKEEKPAPLVPAPAGLGSAPMPRERALDGKTYKLKWPDTPHAFYITINSILDDDNRLRPFEIFINTQNVDAHAWMVALTRMISAVFRRGGDVEFVAKELKEVFDPRGGAWVKGTYVVSLISAIGGIIEEYMQDIGFLEAPEGSNPAGSAETCPSCGEKSMVRSSGCSNCTSCGFSRCG